MIRSNFYDLTTDDRAALTDLVRSLGHNPDDTAADIAITVHHGTVRLHLTEFLLQNGHRYLDVAAERPASHPVVHEVQPDQLPASIRPASEPTGGTR